MARTVYRFQNRLNIAGENIRRIRVSKNWSQRYLADRLQEYNVAVPKNAIQTLEDGTRAAKDIELFALSKVLEVEISQLFDLTPFLENGNQTENIDIRNEISSIPLEETKTSKTYHKPRDNYGLASVAEKK